ncbi:DUF6807 family protein [Specibacter cremeus]|uniref:DUF6807 family protein n=1 Tax=Specibacter cremeus TaxID=1629051 RepID=UPI000F78816C|nr:DUF6807 family protein [Specibacter cremeus]
MTSTNTSPHTGDAPVAGHPAPRPRIALVGVHGFGAHHLANLDRLAEAGVLELVAVADPNPPETGRLGPGVRVFDTLETLLGAGVAPDVVIIATPIHTHAVLGLAALAAGADLYLEKPATASFAQFEQLRDASAAAGRSVQIGFQSLGSLALPALAHLVDAGTLGIIRHVSATGQWVRDKAYYRRSRWAGRRTLDGVDVVDGVTTNPLAHAVATALHIAGIDSAEAISSVETDLYRAHDIEGDDTSVVRIKPAAGPAVVSALTVCAADDGDPFVTVHGTAGTAVFHYTRDILTVTDNAGTRTETYGRTDLLENLLAHRADGTPLLSSLANSGAFMRVLEAVRTAEDPAPIPARHLTWVGEGEQAHPVVAGIAEWIQRATTAAATFSELGAPWARPAPTTAVASLDGRVLAREAGGGSVAPTLSPRPYLHPVTTIAGVAVTDAMPADHAWHLGAGVAIQDVNGVNFWGGRTYRRETTGYVWRPDHGRITLTGASATATARTEALTWTGPDGVDLLVETRTWSWRALDAAAWRLEVTFTLTPAGPDAVTLGSPGSNGREGGGYGGFFWRLPACRGVYVRTANGAGEDAVRGSRAPWLAWSGQFVDGPATLVFTAQDGDPWFVRVEGYPGVGSALAWDSTVRLEPGESLTRSVGIIVADGTVGNDQIDTWTGSR